MRKKSKTNIRKMTFCAIMIALAIVFERLLPLIDLAQVRLSLGNVPIFLSGIVTGPVYGAVCGFVSDLLGCFVKGYAPNPFLMLSPLIKGVLPYFCISFFNKVTHLKKYSLVSVAVSVALSDAISGGIITTLGLSFMSGTPFAIVLIPRIPTTLCNIVVDALCVYFVLKSTNVNVFSNTKEARK